MEIKEIKTICRDSSGSFERDVNKLLNEGYELRNTGICEQKHEDGSDVFWCAILQKRGE